MKNYNRILAYDLGGTKIACGLVTSKGRILSQERKPVRLEQGPKGLVAQMVQLARNVVPHMKFDVVGIASAGPLDPFKGTLLNPTNLQTDETHWGVVSLVAQLKKTFRVPVYLENDAAAAVLAEYSGFRGKKCDNLLAVTLGTGLGVGVIANGELVRSGRLLHPEAGHITLDVHDRELQCGCGNFGCAESFLSGHNFMQRLRQKWRESELTSRDLLKRLQQSDKKSLLELETYSRNLAYFLYSMVVLFGPEVIVVSGGFSHLADYYLPNATKGLAELLKTRRAGVDLMPKVVLSRFQDEIGLIGAARVAVARHGL